MGLINFLRIYWENVKYFFFGGFSYQATSTDGVIYLFHIALLPITLTVCALFKTFIDIFTRKPLAKNEMDTLTAQVATASTKKLNTVTDELIKNSASSRSSNKLLEDLKQETTTHDGKLARVILNKRVDLIILQEGMRSIAELLEKYAEKYIRNDYPLNEDNKAKLDDFIAEQKNTLGAYYAEQKRILIKNYVVDETNAGKRSLLNIYSLFNPTTEGLSSSSAQDAGFMHKQ